MDFNWIVSLGIENAVIAATWRDICKHNRVSKHKYSNEGPIITFYMICFRPCNECVRVFVLTEYEFVTLRLFDYLYLHYVCVAYHINFDKCIVMFIHIILIAVEIVRLRKHTHTTHTMWSMSWITLLLYMYGTCSYGKNIKQNINMKWCFFFRLVFANHSPEF